MSPSSPWFPEVRTASCKRGTFSWCGVHSESWDSTVPESEFAFPVGSLFRFFTCKDMCTGWKQGIALRAEWQFQMDQIPDWKTHPLNNCVGKNLSRISAFPEWLLIYVTLHRSIVHSANWTVILHAAVFHLPPLSPGFIVPKHLSTRKIFTCPQQWDQILALLIPVKP